jgi:hypothetical protein
VIAPATQAGQGGAEVIGRGGRLLAGEALDVRIAQLTDIPLTVSRRPVTQHRRASSHI